MKIRFRVEHPNGDVTFCKVSVSAFKIQTVDAVRQTVQECHPSAKVEHCGYCG